MASLIGTVLSVIGLLVATYCVSLLRRASPTALAERQMSKFQQRVEEMARHYR